ncbi:hypothetical protein [Hoeflea sp.]|uniref:hypothetical protein n=1 Tax=Hoeflea sp. TaxID=1940281 RepID=UPI003B026EBC
MKPVSYFAALLAGVAILVPMGSIDAQAVDIKVQRAVKVHPKAVAKPKIKVSPKVAVKPNVKVKTPKVAVNPKIKIAPKAVKPKIRVNVAAKPKNDSARDAALPPDTAVPAPSAKPTASQREINIAKVPVPKPREPQPGIQDAFEAKEAANAAEAARELAGMNDIRAGANAAGQAPGFLFPPESNDDGKDAPDESSFGEANGNSSKPAFGPDFVDLGGSGISSELFNPAGRNSHSNNASEPGTPGFLNVRNVSVHDANPSGKKPDKPVTEIPQVDPPRQGMSDHLAIDIDDFGNVQHTRTSTREDQTGWTTITTFFDDGARALESWDFDENGDQVGETRYHYVPPPLAERRDPDSAEGGWTPPWMKDDPKTIADKADSIGPGGLPSAPEDAGPGTASNTAPIVSQERLLSRYDTERNDGTSPTPIEPKGACQDC